MKKQPMTAEKSRTEKATEYSFSWREYSRDFAKPLETAHGIWRERRGIVIRLEASDGKVGFGEMAPIPFFDGPDISTCASLCERFVGKITKNNISNTELPSCARFAVGSALAMIGGLLPRRGRWPLARLLPEGSGALFEASRLIRSGCRCFKYKIAGFPEEGERNIIEMLFETLRASGGRLRVDANESLAPDQALDLAAYLAKEGGEALDYLEQPLPRGREGTMLDIMRKSGAEVALDESVAGMKSLREWLFWPGPLVVKPALAGDPLEVAKLLDARGGRVILSSSMESPVGLRGCLMAIGARTPEPLGFGVGVWPEWDGWGEFTDGASIDSLCVTDEDVEAVWNGLMI